MTSSATILVVDDDADVLGAARMLLRGHFARVLTTQEPDEIDRLIERERIDVFLIDMNFAIGHNSARRPVLAQAHHRGRSGCGGDSDDRIR